MTTNAWKESPTHLPLNKDLSLVYRGSLLAALLMALASITGLIAPSAIYPTEAVRQSALANDVVNLFLGLPILLASMEASRRGSLVGLLFWPGALFYILYNYLANLFGIPFGWTTFVYLALAVLSAYLILSLLGSIDSVAVAHRLDGAVPRWLSATFLILFGIGYFFRAVDLIVKIAGDLQTTDLGVLIADIILSSAWIAGGILLIRRQPLGYTSGLGLLFGGTMLFIGLLAFLFLRPHLTGAIFLWDEVIIVGVMSLFCFVPFGLYLRGVYQAGTNE